MPTSIEIDVAALNIGDVIHVSEVEAPKGCEIPYDVDFTVITVVGIKEEEPEEEGEEGEAVMAEEGAEPAEPAAADEE